MTSRAALFSILFFAAASLACLIHRSLGEEAVELSLDESLSRVLGSSKEILGDKMFLKADQYYHGGVETKFHETHETSHAEGDIEDHHDGGDEESEDWISWVNSQVKSREHYHLTREKRREMLPFFALATQLDPHNVEAILTTAYWLETEFSKPQDAMEVLQKGSRDNPSSWEIEERLGRLARDFKKDHQRALAHFYEALRRSEGQSLEPHQKGLLWYYAAEESLILGDQGAARENYRKSLEAYGEEAGPLRQKITEKLQALA